ncbi:MAG: serine/threonine protein kinase [Acidobacteria bacterium]|nr:serine/threonine protein kinase [Acidobacteriota bacterium]
MASDSDPSSPPTAGDLPSTLAVDAPAQAGDARWVPATIGRYRILRLLGEGGMGAVYEAEQEHPRRRVALKVIKPGLAGPELLHRFDRESQALGRLQHPGIAQIYEAGTASTAFGVQPYFAMEFIQGSSLLDYAAARQLNTRQRLKLMAHVCEAVHHAHQRGIIHRDLKPRNILVNDAGQPKVLDFGVARATDSDAYATRQTDVGQLIGTLAYMSPEQVLADPLELDTRSDVYALGVITYQLLAGHLPYNVNRKLHEAVHVIRDEEPTRLSSISRTYRGDIETIVAKALEKDKARRYASAADLAADIWRYLDDEAIIARPPSATYQLHKLARRHKAFVAGLTAVMVALVGGIVASTWQATRATRAERAAVRARDRATSAEHTATADRDRALSAEQTATSERNRAVAAEARAVQERNLARAEQRRADREAATAKAIDDFLQGDLLAQASVSAQARPETKADPDLKVRTALDRAAARITGKFDAQPLVEAAIRQTIGNTYKSLGLYPEAQRQLERALGLQSRVLGAEHLDRLSTMNNLGEVYWNQGDYARAKPLFTGTLEARRRVLGDAHRDTLTTMNDLAALYWSQGQYADAEPLFTKALEGMRRALGEEHPDTLDTMNNLALLYRTQGKLAQAEPLYTRALDAKRRVLGEEHPGTLSTMNNLAALYWSQGKQGQAEPLFTRALEGMRRVLGESHPETLTAMNNLAQVYYAQGNLSQAEPLFTRALEGMRRTLGAEHPNTLSTMNNLALTYFIQRKYVEAETLLRDLLRVFERTVPDSWRRYTSQSLLGASVAGQGKYAEAEPLLLSAYEGLVQRQQTIPPESRSALKEAGDWIVQLYQSWGKADKVAEWTQKLRARS